MVMPHGTERAANCCSNSAATADSKVHIFHWLQALVVGNRMVLREAVFPGKTLQPQQTRQAVRNCLTATNPALKSAQPHWFPWGWCGAGLIHAT